MQEVIQVEAREKILDYIANVKKKGYKQVDVLGLHFATKLPFEEINKVMDQLVKEGLASEGKVDC